MVVDMVSVVAVFTVVVMANAVVTAAIAPLINLPPLQLAVAKAAPSAGGNRTTFMLVLMTQPGRSAAVAAADVVGLFASNAPGALALAPLAAALQARGFPVGVTAMLGPLPAPPPPPVADLVTSAQGQQLAVAIPFHTWQYYQAEYSAAVQMAVAEAMGAPAGTVWVVQTFGAALGGTAISLDIITPATSSERSASGALPLPVLEFARLFGSGDGYDAQTGDAARPELVAALRKYGLPVTGALYNNERPPASRRLSSVRKVLLT
jgi:hypothetical protein